MNCLNTQHQLSYATYCKEFFCCEVYMLPVTDASVWIFSIARSIESRTSSMSYIIRLNT